VPTDTCLVNAGNRAERRLAEALRRRGLTDDEIADEIADADLAAPDKFVSFRELEQLGVPYTRMHINRLIARGVFPQAYWLGANKKAWRLRDIEGWLASRSTLRPVLPPVQGAQDAAD
jgi:prophage regulatory protein